MPDGVPITAGSGTTILTDDTGATGHAQVMKLAVSADGSPTLVTATTANGLAVDVTRVTGQVQVGDGTNAVTVDTTSNDAETANTNSLVTKARLGVYNGTTWDRARGDTANGLDVDVTRVQGSVTVAQATAGNLNATATLAAGTAFIGRVNISDGTNDIGVDTTHVDGEGNTNNHLDVANYNHGFNGTAWDRVRSTTTTFRTAQYTTAQTGVALWTPAAGRAVVITSLQVQAGGTTAGNLQVWFGGAADTTYTRGTDAPIFDGEFAPSATNKPGVYTTFPTPVRGTADFVLRVTSTGPLNPLTVTVWGYEI